MKKAPPDLLVAIIAFLAGALLTVLVHGWYVSEKSAIFGGEPIIHPNYTVLDYLFRQLPFAVGGLASGFIAGIGFWKPVYRLVVRFIFGPVPLFLLIFFHFVNRELATNELNWLYTIFVPSVLLSFLFSTVLSGMYFQLDQWDRNKNRHDD